MSTFGEIVEPGSRTAWEDWDDDSANTNYTTLKWREPLEIEGNIDVLFILEGIFLSECIKMQSQEHLHFVNSILDVNLIIFKTKSLNNYICTVKEYDLLQSSEIIELLKPVLLKSKDVVTIQTKPLSEYKTMNNTYAPLIIKTICTSTVLSKPLNVTFDKLEQPNILSGIGAGVTNLREHLNLSAITFVFYVEHTEEYQTDEVQKILQKLEIIKSCKTKINSILNSNLYI